MKVYGELEKAQLEGFATVDLPSASANFRRVVYDTTVNLAKISDGTSWRTFAAGLLSKYKYIVGADPAADFTTLTAALTAHSSNTSFLLDSSYVAVENVAIAGNGILIEGEGIISVIQGTLTINTGVQYARVSNLKVTGNITLGTSSANNIVRDIWVSPSVVITDNGVNGSNNIEASQL